MLRIPCQQTMPLFLFVLNLSHDIVQIILCNFNCCFKNHQTYYQTNYRIQFRIAHVCNHNTYQNADWGYDVHPLMLAVCNNRRTFYLPSKIDDIPAHCKVHDNSNKGHACSQITGSCDWSTEENLFNRMWLCRIWYEHLRK